MPSIINADNGIASGSVGLKYSSDNSGVLALQSNNNTIISASNTLTTISSTNVGIGTNSPATKLHVASGDIRVDAGQGITFGDTNNFIIGNSPANTLRFYSNNSERVRIISTGSVGIGTTSPSYSLDVVGTVRGTTGLISGPYRTVNLTGNYSNGTWYSIGDTTNLVQGTWIVNAYVDTYAAGSAIYFMMYSSVPFYIQATSSNNADTFAIPQMIGSGHSPNGVLPPSLRIRQSFQASSDAGKIFVEFNPNANWTGLDGTGGKNVVFTFKRLTE